MQLHRTSDDPPGDLVLPCGFFVTKSLFSVLTPCPKASRLAFATQIAPWLQVAQLLLLDMARQSLSYIAGSGGVSSKNQKIVLSYERDTCQSTHFLTYRYSFINLFRAG